MYDDEAPYYDVIYEGVGKDWHTEASQVLDEVAQILRRAPKDLTLLDVACGTGRHLSSFQGWFSHVEGVDLSPQMLDVARRRCPNIPFHKGDMRSFDLSKQFDVVTCMFSAIGHMLTTANLNLAVKNMANHLRPGGILIIEGWLEPEDWLDGKSLSAVHVEGDGFLLDRHTIGVRDDQFVDLHMSFMYTTRRGTRRAEELHKTKMWRASDYVTAFNSAGFKVVAVMKSVGTGRNLYVGIKPARPR